jgi:hypothetical protein
MTRSREMIDEIMRIEDQDELIERLIVLSALAILTAVLSVILW